MPLHCDELTGSSPRMQGTREHAVALRRTHGIIPAHAGNTGGVRPSLVPLRDHPRACGEHFGTAFAAAVPTGSSPRMRGTPRTRRIVRLIAGIIPAHAGNTFRWLFFGRFQRDHPRACGEHPYRIIPIPESMGSSPRMRGTHHIPHRGRFVPGIIPAHAGNTSS